jgi:hypothetical protein
MQGYTNKQITILTAYSGQVRLLRNDLRNLNITNVYVTSVDNYQGEENDIILLSLVRSNKRGIIGFLSTSNRICVALSRAKIGFYLIGNASLLGAKNGTWSKILEILRSGNAIGTELVLQCQLHPQKTTAVARDSDFKKAEDGGCDKQCGATLECGHVVRPCLCHTNLGAMVLTILCFSAPACAILTLTQKYDAFNRVQRCNHVAINANGVALRFVFAALFNSAVYAAD